MTRNDEDWPQHCYFYAKWNLELWKKIQESNKEVCALMCGDVQAIKGR